MKAALLVIAVAILVTVSSAQSRVEGTLLTTKVSVAGCSQPVVLTLRAESIIGNIEGDQFNEIIFTIGSRDFQFNMQTPLIRLRPYPFNPPEDFTRLKGISIAPAGYFLRTHYNSAAGDRPLFLFVGLSSGGGSDPESLFIFGFRSDCTPYQVFQSGAFDLTAFETDPAGGAVLIGKDSLSQIMAGADGAWQSGKPYATTYDPFSVYRINLAQGTAEYSLKDSEEYNRTHYCWAGPHMSEAKAVVYSRLKKNSIECMSADRAKNLIR